MAIRDSGREPIRGRVFPFLLEMICGDVFAGRARTGSLTAYVISRTTYLPQFTFSLKGAGLMFEN
jgi:hypothetical protein